ncbi:hypothetical protein DITRI_Ditri10aG0071100 [Diplodiscus trichospermus]
MTRNRYGVNVQRHRSFRGEDGVEVEEKVKENERKFSVQSRDEYEKVMAKVEKVFSLIAIQIGRYIVTMMSTAVILLTGFQLSGGDNQMNALIWYS